MTEPVLSAIYDFKNLVLNTAQNGAYEAAFPITHPEKMVDNNVLLGIEIEVENMKKSLPIVEFYWNVKDDNSLRNNGLEFTSTPLRAKQVEYALDYYNKVATANNKPDYSNRTSVHVHINVRDLTLDQIKNFVLLYALFEKHFFHIAGTKRESSIFCVPLYKTTPVGNISNLENHLQYWHKYNALNLGTVIGSNGLPMYGTVEFRHLYGTGDKKTIINWINNILALRKEAISWKLNDLLNHVKTLNTTSEYIHLYQRTFGDMVMLDKMEKYDFESCVSFAKTWEWGHKLRAKYQLRNNSCYRTKYVVEEMKINNDGPKLATTKTYFNGEKQLKNYTSCQLTANTDENGTTWVRNETEGWSAMYMAPGDNELFEKLTSKTYQIFGIDDQEAFYLVYVQSARLGTVCLTKTDAKKLDLNLHFKYNKPVLNPNMPLEKWTDNNDKITIPKPNDPFDIPTITPIVNTTTQETNPNWNLIAAEITKFQQEQTKTKQNANKNWFNVDWNANADPVPAKKPTKKVVTKVAKVKKPTNLLNKLLNEMG